MNNQPTVIANLDLQAANRERATRAARSYKALRNLENDFADFGDIPHAKMTAQVADDILAQAKAMGYDLEVM